MNLILSLDHLKVINFTFVVCLFVDFNETRINPPMMIAKFTVCKLFCCSREWFHAKILFIFHPLLNLSGKVFPDFPNDLIFDGNFKDFLHPLCVLNIDFNYHIISIIFWNRQVANFVSVTASETQFVIICINLLYLFLLMFENN